jgi:hypothetical protein
MNGIRQQDRCSFSRALSVCDPSAINPAMSTAADRQCQSNISLSSIVSIGRTGEHVEPGPEVAPARA